MSYTVDAPFEPAGDQPEAIEQLVDGFQRGLDSQTLLGVTLVLWIGGGIVYAATARLAWNSVHSVPARVWKA